MPLTSFDLLDFGDIALEFALNLSLLLEECLGDARGNALH